jgi:hypothetical protein
LLSLSTIKGETGRPMWGSQNKQDTTLFKPKNTLNPQRPGNRSLSQPFVTSTTNSSASNMSQSSLDVGTFRSNQYTFSCSLCTPSEPRRAYITRWC